MNSTRRGFLQLLLTSPVLAKLGFRRAEAAPVPPVPLAPPAPEPRSSRVIPWEVPLPWDLTPLLYYLTARRPIREVVNPTYMWLEGREQCYNHPQIFRHHFGNSDDALWHLGEHYKDIEYALFHGKRWRRAGRNGADQTFTGGIEFFCPAKPVSGDIAEYLGRHPELVEGAVRGHKLLFVSPEAADKIQYKEIVLVSGRVTVVPTFVLYYDSRNPAFLVDPERLRLVRFKGRGTKLLGLDNTEFPSTTFEYLSDYGLELQEPGAHHTFLLGG